MALIDRPSFTVTHEEGSYSYPAGASVVYGRSVEERSEYAPHHSGGASDIYEIQVQERQSFVWEGPGDAGGEVGLRSDTDLAAFADLLGDDVVVDITGLNHHIWAPIIRSLLGGSSRLRCVYVEPMTYKRHTAPTEYELFDLSERIDGVAPIPGFASLSMSDDFVFAPLLGFEGRRLAYVLETVQPRDDRIYPVIGVPGFRPEYPFYTYEGNRLALEDSGAFSQVMYARANCPFALYFALEGLMSHMPAAPVAVALIGTKPHSLGGVLFAILSERDVEVVYDYPVRKQQRTEGAARALEYHLSAFVAWLNQS